MALDISKANKNKRREQKQNKQQDQSRSSEENEEEEGDLCFICTEPVSIFAVSECDHRTCHKCTLRLRALYKTRNCAYCKADQKWILLTKDADKPFDQYTTNDTPFVDKKLNIKFETQAMYDETMHLLDYNCPYQKGCRETASDLTELKLHVRKVHELNLCDLCCRHKKVFPSEQYLYTSSQLTKHYREGDKDFNKEDETGFSGHPECSFCKTRFYGGDELFVHCRDQHEQCFICVRNGNRDEYYANYASLEDHFKSDHAICPYPSCLEKKFVVFETSIDLKAHEVEVHGESISGLQRSLQSQSRQLEVNFQYESYRDQRKKGKKREEQPATPPSHSLDAFPRIASSSSISSGSSSNNQQQKESAKPVRTVPGASTKKGKGKAIQKPAGFGSLSEAAVTPPFVNASSSAPPENQHDLDTVALHTDFIGKVGNMLQSKAKVQEFRSLTSAYRKSNISCQDYVNQIYLLTNQHVQNTAKIIKGVEGLLDIDEKKSELVRVWRNKQTALSNFPALETKEKPKQTTSRVLVIKPQPKKTVVGQKKKSASNVWDKVATAASVATSSKTPQSSVPSSPRSSIPSSPQTSRPSSPLLSNTSWVGGQKSPEKQSKSDFPSLKPQLFPSLPAAAPKHNAILNMRQNKQANGSAWGSSTNESPPPQQQEDVNDNKKKKGRKNKVLFRVGL
ncbi:hypothetical protein BD560DRAFT_395686 [Blakeslea trispora]|nr:hypothetical protein BD560DRAFT_395686 [Blakeslea trispora]